MWEKSGHAWLFSNIIRRCTAGRGAKGDNLRPGGHLLKHALVFCLFFVMFNVCFRIFLIIKVHLINITFSKRFKEALFLFVSLHVKFGWRKWKNVKTLKIFIELISKYVERVFLILSNTYSMVHIILFKFTAFAL